MYIFHQNPAWYTHLIIHKKCCSSWCQLMHVIGEAAVSKTHKTHTRCANQVFYFQNFCLATIHIYSLARKRNLIQKFVEMNPNENQHEKNVWTHAHKPSRPTRDPSRQTYICTYVYMCIYPTMYVRYSSCSSLMHMLISIYFFLIYSYCYYWLYLALTPLHTYTGVHCLPTVYHRRRRPRLRLRPR